MWTPSRRLAPSPDPSRREDLLILGIGLALALAIRYVLRPLVNADLYYPGLPYTGEIVGQTTTWYDVILQRGFAAFRETFSDYTPPYLYCLYLIALVDRALLWISPVVAVKLPSMITDFVAAYYVWRIVQLLHPRTPLPLFALLATLFWPTVLLNSSVWGQMDILYTAPLLASLYYFLCNRHQAAWIAFALAFAVKLQAVFMAPLLLALLLRRETAWRYVLYVPAVYLVMIVPFWLAGRPLGDLLTIYATQVTMYDALTMDAASIFALLPAPADQMEALAAGGILLGAGVTLLFVLVVLKSRERLQPSTLILLAFASQLLIPFVLPRMHQRYFFAADVFAILFAFSDRRNFPVAVAVTCVSALSYMRFLFGVPVFPLSVLAIAMGVAVVIVSRQMLDRLHPAPHEPARV